MVLSDNKDPSWIRTACRNGKNVYKEYIMSGMRHDYYVHLENLTIELSSMICDTATKYHTNQVS